MKCAPFSQYPSFYRISSSVPFLKLRTVLLILTDAVQMYGLCDHIPLEDAGIHEGALCEVVLPLVTIDFELSESLLVGAVNNSISQPKSNSNLIMSVFSFAY